MWRADAEQNIIEVDVAKGRNSEIGSVQMQFDGAHMRFYHLKYDEYRQTISSSSRKNKYLKGGRYEE
jgi:hypothetical protein